MRQNRIASYRRACTADFAQCRNDNPRRLAAEIERLAQASVEGRAGIEVLRTIRKLGHCHALDAMELAGLVQLARGSIPLLLYLLAAPIFSSFGEWSDWHAAQRVAGSYPCSTAGQ